MTHFFIAFEVQPTKEIASIQKKFKIDGEFTKDSQFHCTLLFLGDKINEKDVINAIKDLDAQPILAETSKIIRLSDSRYKNAFVIKLDNDKIKQIYNKLKSRLNIKSSQEFIPHITLIRTNQESSLPRIIRFYITLNRVTLYKADIVNGEAVYVKIFTKYLDNFENTINKILEDLRDLNDIDGVDVGILYGSTASGKIKKPVHDIDLYILTKNATFPLGSIKKIKKRVDGIKRKYSSQEFHVSSWCVGLGRVFELHKIEKGKNHIGIELMPLCELTNNQVSRGEIEKRGLKVLFGDTSHILNLHERFDISDDAGSLEFLASRMMNDLVTNKKSRLFSLYFPFLMFSFLKYKRISFKSKDDALEKFKKYLPNIKIPEEENNKELLKFYDNLIEAV